MSVALRAWNIPRDALARCVLILAYLAVLSNAEYFLPRTSGIMTFILATALVVTFILTVRGAGELIASILGWKIRLYPLTLMTLVAGSVMTSLVVIKVFLQLVSAFENPATKDSLLPALAMLREWERRLVQVAGAQSNDIYTILQRKLLTLRPDLVFYGVYLNDFLPSGAGKYGNNW